MKKGLFLFSILLSFLFSCKKEDKDTSLYTLTTMQYKSVSGVDANLLSLDIYHYGQNTGSKPVVIYVHGGGFSTGDKSNNMINKKNLFSSLDYIFVSINYRLSPATYSTDPNRIMYPTHNNDVADAIKWIYDNIGNYGGNKDKMALLGHSAGAHLVALTGVSSQFLPTRGLVLDKIKGVACIDTEGYNVEDQCLDNNQVYLNAFGQTNTNWVVASPVKNLVNGTTYPRFFIAKRGTNKRIGYADAFINQLIGVSASVQQITASQYDHEGINDAIGKEGETAVTEPLKSFYATCFQ